MLGGAASLPEAPTWAVVTVTAIPADTSPTPEELRAEVHSVVHAVVQIARSEHGSVPGVGTAAWWAAPTSARLAAVLILGEAYILRSPDQIADDILKASSVEISIELQRQRELTRRRKNEIDSALRSGDSARAIALTKHHASDRWAVEVA